MSEVSTAFMAGRLSTETCKCNSFNLDRIFGNGTGKSNDYMDEKHNEIAHFLIITNPGIAWS
jgi:hypothetical protein